MNKIENYSFGRISICGRRYERDLIIYPDRVQDDWWRKEGHMLQPEDIPAVLSDPPDALIVGLGEPGKMRIDSRLAQELERLNVPLISAPTKHACEKFNELSQQGKYVVAALHLTC